MGKMMGITKTNVVKLSDHPRFQSFKPWISEEERVELVNWYQRNLKKLQLKGQIDKLEQEDGIHWTS